MLHYSKKRILKSKPYIHLSAEELKKGKLPKRHITHIRKVLRMKGSFEAEISDGVNLLYAVNISETNDIKIIRSQNIPERSSSLKIIQARIKPSRLSVLIEKLSELGVTEIQFCSSEFSQVPRLKIDKMQKISENACMQSHNPRIPNILDNELGIEDFEFDSKENVFWGEIGSNNSFENEELLKSSRVVFINGPEGGWSEREKAFLKNRFRSISLSNTVLRAETAAISVASIFRFKNLIL